MKLICVFVLIHGVQLCLGTIEMILLRIPIDLTSWTLNSADILYHEQTATIYGQALFSPCTNYQFKLTIHNSNASFSTKMKNTLGSSCYNLCLDWNSTETTTTPSILSWYTDLSNTYVFKSSLAGIFLENVATFSGLLTTGADFFGTGRFDKRLTRWDPKSRSIRWATQVVQSPYWIFKVFNTPLLSFLTVLVGDGTNEQVVSIEYKTGRLSSSFTSTACPSGWSTHHIHNDSDFQLFVCWCVVDGSAVMESWKLRVLRLVRDVTPLIWEGPGRVVDIQVTLNHLIISIQYQNSFYCFVRLNITSLDAEEPLCPFGKGVAPGSPRSTMRLFSQGKYLSTIWEFYQPFRFKNSTFSQGLYVLHMTLGGSVSGGGITWSTATATPTSRSEKPTENNHESGMIYSTIGVAVGSLGSLILILIVLSLVYRNRARKLSKDMDMIQTNMSVQTSLSIQTCTSIQSAMTYITNTLPLAVPGYLKINSHDFRSVKALARGGAGAVFLVQIFDPALITRAESSTAVAKCLLTGSAVNSAQRQVFLQEVALLHYLNTQHEGFAQLYGFTEEESPTMILKYYTFGSLKVFIGSSVIWSKELRLALALDMTRALGTMHGLGFVHCDIKADNILVDERAENDAKKRYCCVLTDLGIARVVTDTTLGVSEFRPKTVLGLSMNYAAPELLRVYRSKEKDRRTSDVLMSGDIYALAVVFYQLITRSDQIPARFNEVGNCGTAAIFTTSTAAPLSVLSHLRDMKLIHVFTLFQGVQLCFGETEMSLLRIPIDLASGILDSVDLLHYEQTETIYGQALFSSCVVHHFALPIRNPNASFSMKVKNTLSSSCYGLCLDWNATETTTTPSILSWYVDSKNLKTYIFKNMLNASVWENIVSLDRPLSTVPDSFGLGYALTGLTRWDPQSRSIRWSTEVAESPYWIYKVYRDPFSSSFPVLVGNGTNEKIISVDYETGVLVSSSSYFNAAACPPGWNIHYIHHDAEIQVLICSIYVYLAAGSVAAKVKVHRLVKDWQPLTWDGTGYPIDSQVTLSHLIMIIRYPRQNGDRYCFIRMHIMSLDAEEPLCPFDDGAPGYPRGIMRLFSRGKYLSTIWQFHQPFWFKNGTFSKGLYVLLMTMGGSMSDGGSTVTAIPTHLRKKLNPTGNNPGYNIIYLSFGVAVGGLLLLIIILTLLNMMHRKRARKLRDVDTAQTGMSTQSAMTYFTNTLPISIPGYLKINPRDFQLMEPLARGGAGVVFLAQLLDPTLKGRAHSSTAVAKNLLKGPAATSAQLQLFLQEVALLHYLNNQHEGFAQLYGFTEESPTMILKYYPLGSLKVFLGSSVIWSKELILALALDMTRALGTMHRLGFVHCDIKADNILIDERAENDAKKRYCCVLTDLGIARVVTDTTLGVSEFRPKDVFGLSVYYAAPELLRVYRRGRRVRDRRTPDVLMSGDIYALAVVFYQLITRSNQVWPGF